MRRTRWSARQHGENCDAKFTGSLVSALNKILVACSTSVFISLCTTAAGAQEFTDPSPQEVVSEETPLSIDSVWKATVDALDSGNISTAVDNFEKLKKLRNENGYEVLETQSLDLIARAQKALTANRYDDAALYVRKAIELSPTSSRVLFKSLPLVEATGVRVPGMESQWGQFVEALMLLGRSRDLCLKILKVSLYPFAWALTIGVFLTLVLSLTFNFHVMVARVAKILPVSIRGFFAMPLVLLSVVIPLMAGPVTCVLVWTVLSLLWIREKSLLPLFGGAVLVVWGAVIPIREHLAERLEDPGIQALLRVSSGQFGPSDRAALEDFLALRQGDMGAQLLLGQVLRREGLYEESIRLLKNAQKSWGKKDRWISAQLGLAYFLRGDSQEADKYFNQAQEEGMDSVAFWFDYSKIKFDLTDTAQSSAFYQRALDKDAGLTTELKSREDELGLHNRFSLAELPIPIHLLAPSILVASSDRSKEYDARTSQLVPSTNPLSLMGIGICIVLVSFFMARGAARVRRLAFFSRFKLWRPFQWVLQLCPGGAWVSIGKPASAACIVSLLVFLALPFVAWPTDSTEFLSYIPGIKPMYAAVVALLTLSVYYVGYFLAEEEE